MLFCSIKRKCYGKNLTKRMSLFTDSITNIDTYIRLSHDYSSFNVYFLRIIILLFFRIIMNRYGAFMNKSLHKIVLNSKSFHKCSFIS